MPRSITERCESTFVKVLKYLSDTHAVQTLGLSYFSYGLSKKYLSDTHVVQTLALSDFT